MDTLTSSFGVKPDATIDSLLWTVFAEDVTSGFSLLALSSLTLYPAALVVWVAAELLADSTWNWDNFNAEVEVGMLQTWADSGALSSEGSDSGSSEKRLIPDCMEGVFSERNGGWNLIYMKMNLELQHLVSAKNWKERSSKVKRKMSMLIHYWWRCKVS